MAAEDAIISNNERKFILRALSENLRVDGRFFLEQRKISAAFDRREGTSSCEIVLGNTRVFCNVTADIVAPYPERPTDGFISIVVNVSAIAGTSFETNRNTPRTIELSRLLERQIRDARAIDTEALCIIPGEKVWQLRCDVHVLDDCGNVTDAAAAALIGALLHFRRADVSVRGDAVTVLSYSERAPVPLAIHHTPLCCTYAIFSGLPAPATAVASASSAAAPASAASTSATAAAGPAADVIILDPTDREELVATGTLTLCMNAHRELCGVHKPGGTAVEPEAILECVRIAAEKVEWLANFLKKAQADAETAFAERARQKHAAAAGFAAGYESVQLPSQPPMG